MEFELLILGELLLDRVVRALNEHVVEAHLLEQEGHGGRVAERVDRPSTARLHTCHSQEDSIIWLHKHQVKRIYMLVQRLILHRMVSNGAKQLDHGNAYM